MPVRKGSKYLHETAAFIAAFPMSTDPDKETVISVAAFDAWADQCGYYTLNCEQATLLEARNKLKKKINISASSPAWLKQDETPFFIAVSQYGKTYAVKRVEEAFSDKAVRLPAQVKSYATTKQEAIKALLGSIKINALPAAWQLRISSFDREIERYLRGIDYQTMELDREYNAIKGQLKLLLDQKMIAPNGDDHLLQLMGIEADD
jgi:hypothetical protein